MDNTKIDFPNDWQDNLAKKGHFAVNLPLESTVLELVHKEDWESLDSYFMQLTSPTGELFKVLSKFCDFKAIEFIISIRDAQNPWEEDGIWHDDGSRKLAFSLSLTKDHQEVEGGVLEIRQKGNQDSFKLKPFEYGKMIVFATGENNFEHKINQVTKGKRIIIAGWCQ